MEWIDEQNAAAYLRSRDRIGSQEPVQVRELTGGVSNVVLYVSRSKGDDFVLKQAREQLRVADPWFCSVERIWREVEVLQVCQRVLGAAETTTLQATTPQLLFADRENYLYAMTAVPSHETWKEQLLRGEVDHGKAAACGWLLGTLHAGTWNGRGLPEQLSDRQFFDDLRIDPYYRQVARVHPDLQGVMNELIASVFAHRECLVHGDFSPKNLLVHAGGMVLVDFEVGHFGDPAFDLGFFLTHLFLKAFYRRPHHEPILALIAQFWNSYLRQMRTATTDETSIALDRRGAFNVAGCLLARIDGKSQAEYLDETTRCEVRDFARGLLLSPAASIIDLLDQARGCLNH